MDVLASNNIVTIVGRSSRGRGVIARRRRSCVGRVRRSWSGGKVVVTETLHDHVDILVLSSFT